jgi:hypothetical protein
MRISENPIQDGGYSAGRGSTDHVGARTRGLRDRRFPRRVSPRAIAFSGTIFRLRPALEVIEDRTLLSNFLVNTTADSGPGSLRQAILDSNAATGQSNTIDFDIPGQGVQTIAPLSPLPAITQAVLIDGFSQPGYAGTPLIELSGSQLATGDGLTISGPDVAGGGLDINDFSQGAGIRITGTSATRDWIDGNFVGTDPSGTRAVPNNVGVEVDAGSSNNLVGTGGKGMNDAVERNVLSGNFYANLWIDGQGTNGNVVAGNFIGTDVTGTQALASGSESGVLIADGARSNWIGVNPNGGAAIGDEGNVIAGAPNDGIQIANGSNDNAVAGNRIGTDVTGTVGLGNQKNGIEIDSGCSGNTIGGSASVAANVISANASYGVWITGTGATGNLVQGDIIGAGITGTLSLGNGQSGVQIDSGASWNTIGGTTSVASNLISQNGGPGVVVGASPGDTTTGDQVTANRIFDNKGQAIDLGNDGVSYNSTSLRQGPNNFQNFPIIAMSADGQLQGWLGASTPETNFRIDVFASAAYGPGGSGEAQAYLGSLNATTDATGQVSFAVPFAAPAALPILTATAIDPHGNTSEVSALRRATLEAPRQSVRVVPERALRFSSAPGDGIAIQDPDAGLFDPAWNLVLSVMAGTLTLTGSAGLTGSGNGTGSLTYSGSLAELNIALKGLTYNPPAAPHVLTTLTLRAQSEGAPPLETQLVLTDGVFVVTTTADSGPGSLRQAILDSNTTAGGTITISFAIPGTGMQVISPTSPLPPIINSALIDGSSQPGYSGTPLIALISQSPGRPGLLAISGPNVAIRGLAIESVAIDATADENLIAIVHAQGFTTSLSLVASQGTVLAQSDGLSATVPDDAINEHLAAGTYYLRVASTTAGGQGTYTLTTMLTPATAPFQPIPDQGQPTSAVAGDFSGDGHLDLAVANIASNTVSVLLGNGDGTFQPQVTYAVGNSPAFITEGDFNGDGHLDLAVANANYFGSGPGDVSILLGNGDGTFQPQVTYAVGYQPSALAAGDFTGNGRTDLAVANFFDNTVSVMLGNGDGTFQPARTVASGVAGPLVAGDFNGDGRLDLAVANADGVHMLVGNGDGTFQPAQTVALGISGLLVAGDFTGDGHVDLAVVNYNGNSVSVLLGNGDGTFRPGVTYPAGLNPISIVAGDFNGDGKLDLATGNWGDGTVSVLLGNGDGTFQPPVSSEPGIAVDSIVAGDFARHGDLDLAVATVANVTLLLGNGNGTFQPQLRAGTAAGASPFSLAAGDFTGNGRLDVAVANLSSNNVSVLLGNSDGTFQPQVSYPVGPTPESIVAGDFNSDGRLDLAILNTNEFGGGGPGSVSVLLGNGGGTFQPQVAYSVGAYPGSIVAGDFARNGRLDLVVADADGVQILLNNGDGSFQPAKTVAAGICGTLVAGNPLSISGALVTGDFNGDGKLDLAVANAVSHEVSVLLGNGDGTFLPATTFAAGFTSQSSFFDASEALVAADFNGDGKLDLAVADGGSPGSGQDAAGGVIVFLGNGDGTFQPGKEFAAGANPTFLVAGDFNGDGRPDLAVGGLFFSNNVSVLLGNGDGTFQPPQAYPVGGGDDAIATGDFNGDGHLDLATSNFSGTVSVLLSTGDGMIAGTGQLVTAPHDTPLVANLTGDGSDGVLIVDGAGNILYRRGVRGQPGSFEPPVTVNPNNPSRDIAFVPESSIGPLIASVDAHDNHVSLYAYRNGGFIQVGSLSSGRLPAQIIAADLDHRGWTDLIVRNAGDGTLSVFFNDGSGTFHTGFGPFGPFLTPVTIPVGFGVSDVAPVDTTGTGTYDLIVTNKLSGQVSVLLNLGGRRFAPPVPYRAGTGLSVVDPSSTPEVTSLEATAGLAAGPLTPGGSTDLVTINPGSNTMDVLVGLGRGRFANPVSIDTPSPALVVRAADFTGNGIEDLAVLTTTGLSIYLGDGKGGFLPPKTYAVPPEADGLTVADVLGNGTLDLLVGDAYGDVLVLLGNGDGTFQPYHEANQTIELAVADLTGKGSKDIIYADQGLDRVVVDYGAGNSTVLGSQSTGVLAPGAVTLADLNGDGIPDLIVANSGSNNVLIYPGLGNGQFGPVVNGGHGYFTGTNPVGITVANLTGALPDLVVANKGSNDVSILLNQGNFSFTQGPRLKSGGSGPVSTVVGHFTASPYPDILVTNSGSNNVALLPGVGGGFFNDTNPQTFAVGASPGPLFVGNFDGNPDLLTVNAGSNDLTLISNFMSADATTNTIASGGTDPVTAFSFSGSSGFDNLVVGNGGNGVLALFEGSAAGLTLTSSETNPDLPSPSALVYAGVGGGQVEFYAATEGREAAALVALSLGGEIGPLASPAGSATPVVAQLVPLQESSLALTGTLLIATIESQGGEAHLGSLEAEAGAAAALTVSSAAPPGVGQAVAVPALGGETVGGGEELSANPEAPPAGVPAPAASPSWQRIILRPEEAIQKFNRQHPDLFPPSGDDPQEANPTGAESQSPAPATPTTPPGQSSPAPAQARLGTIDRAIELLIGNDLVALEHSGGTERRSAAPGHLKVAVSGPNVQPAVPEPLHQPETVGILAQPLRQSGEALMLPNAKRARKPDVSASLVLAATVAAGFYAHSTGRRVRNRPCAFGPGRQPVSRPRGQDDRV